MTDLVQRLAAALPRVMGWIDDRLAEHAARASPIANTSDAFRRLADTSRPTC